MTCEMKRLVLFLTVCLFFVCCGKKGDDITIAPKPVVTVKCTVHLIGDSTCATKSEDDHQNLGKYGWGEKFAAYLDGNKVENRAVGGKSTKTYIEGGQWAKYLKTFKKGDVVLIQFGHNDESTSSSDGRGTTPEEYYNNLCRMIAEAQVSKEAVAVILTPISRLSFTNGVPNHTHKEYPEYAKKAAADKGAVLLDIEQLTYDWLAELGEEAAKLRFANGGNDNTHLSELGADEIAEIVAKALKASGNPYLAKLVK